MAKYIRGEWNQTPAAFSPLHQYLSPYLEFFQSFSQWPGLSDYQAYFDASPRAVRNKQATPLKVVENNFEPREFEEFYAPQIYLKAELQIRHENWHDFFQLVSWRIFPLAKAQINSMHLPMAHQRHTQNITSGRSQLENMLSQFDETGVVIVSDKPELLALVKEFRWKELFWEQRATLAQHFTCIVFGHGLLEKAIHPYVGMTGKAILIESEQEFFYYDIDQQTRYIDKRLTTLFTDGVLTSPLDLCPFPVLGIPDWWSEQTESFYDNQDYFRPGRTRLIRKEDGKATV